jgi:hypothetical protein
MKTTHWLGTWLTAALLILAGCDSGAVATGGAGSEGAARTSTSASQSAVRAEPTAGDREYARITANWSDAALETCGRGLRDVLGTRDLVQGALDGVRDPAGKADAEIADARHWLSLGDARFAEIRPRLEVGVCDGDVTVALDEVWQLYVKAGTSAVQAGQIAGS